jgi:hypothetical protein
MNDFPYGIFTGAVLTVIASVIISLIGKLIDKVKMRKKAASEGADSAGAAEPSEWDLTDDEATELKGIWDHRRTERFLLREVEKLDIENNSEEAIWWDSVSRRIGIPVEFRDKLGADHDRKKIWVLNDKKDK